MEEAAHGIQGGYGVVKLTERLHQVS